MNSILITGCNRGIGLNLIKYLLNYTNTPKYIIATCRNINQAQELKTLQNNNKNLHIFEIDLTNFSKYNDLLKNVQEITQNDGLNCLINNAGISTKFTRLNLTKSEQLIENFSINTVAPIILTKTMLPLLQISATKSTFQKGIVVNMSSILGSIGKNDSGGFYPYRCSKAALNAATKSMSIDLMKDNIVAVSIHPGWVKTDMGGPKAPLEVDKAAEHIIKLINSLTMKQSGSFLQYDGTELPW